MHVVLERNRNAVERSAHATVGPLTVESVRLRECVGVDGDRGVHALLVEGDAQEVGLDQFARGDATVGHRTLHVGDGRLDHVEGLDRGVARLGVRVYRARRDEHRNQGGRDHQGRAALERVHGSRIRFSDSF